MRHSGADVGRGADERRKRRLWTWNVGRWADKDNTVAMETQTAPQAEETNPSSKSAVKSVSFAK